MNTVEMNSILSAEVLKRKIRRMAFEIAERNWNVDSLIIAGVEGNGEVVAKSVIAELKQMVSYPIQMVTVHTSKTNPSTSTIKTDIDFNDKTVVVVDDVANTGKVMLFSLKHFLSFQPRSIQTLVLVERSHKMYPVQIDYVGLSVSTTLKEHITVKASDNEITGVWLH